jgi:ABC-2 type transport system ATP-binding protein
MLPIEVSSLKNTTADLKAVDGISFTVNPGEVFGLLGPNGAGKTTTIEIMEGLRERDGGDVKVLGFDPWKNGYDLHKKIGVIPQEFTFFEKTTPREAIIYYADLFNVKVNPDEILKKFCLRNLPKPISIAFQAGKSRRQDLRFHLLTRLNCFS